MSYGIVRIQKMGIGSVKGIEIHDCRKKEFSHTNQDISWDMSIQNYDLCNKQNINFTKAVKERIGELDLPKAVRKDAVVMAQVLVTSDNGFFKGLDKKQQEQFFKDSYNFLSERYGMENVISATVHLDESTPHMHFNFVPVTSDGRLSAKSLLTRQSLIDQQTAFYENVGKKYGLERGLEGGNKKHFEIAELKLKTINEKIKQQVKAFEKDKINFQKEIESIKLELGELTTKAESKMNDFNQITKAFKERSETIKNNYEKANVVLDKQADEIKNRTEKIHEQDFAIKYKNKRLDFQSKDIEAQEETLRKNREIISKQVDTFIKNKNILENQAIEIKKHEHAIESMRDIWKAVRDDLERTVNDFNAQDKQVLNRAVEFIKYLPNELQERWERFNVERKRTPSAWAKKLANEKKNSLER